MNVGLLGLIFYLKFVFKTDSEMKIWFIHEPRVLKKIVLKVLSFLSTHFKNKLRI